MSCNLTSGISKGCRDNAGGIVEVYIGNYPSGYTAQEWYTETEGNVSSITGLTVFTFVPNKNSSNWVENIQSSVENGTIGYEQVLTLVFSKNEATKRNQIKLLGQANLSVIIRDRNSKYWLLGAQEGMELNGGTSSSGTVLNDLNGWSITLQAKEPYPAYEITAAVVSGLITD